MKSKKGYLIDPKNQSMTEVEVGDYKDIQKHLNCRVFSSADYYLKREPFDRYGSLNDSLYIDDEGLLIDDEDTNFCFTFGICDPIYSKGLIMGLDYDNGETTDKPFVPMEIYSDHIIFGWSAYKPKPRFEIRPFTLEDLK